MLRILFAEAHRGFRQSASLMLAREPDLEVMAQAGSVSEGRRWMVEGGMDAAIVDVPLLDEYGLELVREMHGANPSIPVLVLTETQDRKRRNDLLEAGAREVLSKGVGYEGVLAAVRRLGESQTGDVRVVFAYEETHLTYRDTLVGAVRAIRPHVAVTAVSLRSLASEVKRLDPHLVVSSRPNTTDPGNRPAWYRLAHEPDEPSEVCIEGKRSSQENPGLDTLIELIDQTEDLIRTGQDPKGC
ncbi:response regulator [Rubrobacter tropicus]|uniref:response regulator n=1 Tax=Rubrobacter tropicus TaxID=2653851 RepID=UPI00140B4F92|nr:response regulator [Rubrobacter tropicus]